MDALIKRTERLIEKYETYINNMLSVDMSSANLPRRIEHAQRINDYREMVKDLQGIKIQLQYHPVS